MSPARTGTSGAPSRHTSLYACLYKRPHTRSTCTGHGLTACTAPHHAHARTRTRTWQFYRPGFKIVKLPYTPVRRLCVFCMCASVRACVRARACALCAVRPCLVHVVPCCVVPRHVASYRTVPRHAALRHTVPCMRMRARACVCTCACVRVGRGARFVHGTHAGAHCVRVQTHLCLGTGTV